MGVAQAVRNPGTFTRERLRMLRLVLFAPDRFYDEYVGNRGFRGEILLVALIGAVGAIGTAAAVYVTMSQFDTSGVGGELPRGVSFRLVGQAVSPVLQALLVWALLGFVLYAASWFYSERGSYTLLLKKFAWALVPLAIANIVISAAMIYAAMTATIEPEFAAAVPDQQFAEIWDPIATNNVLVAARALGIVVFAWCGYIAARAVVEVREIDLPEAYRAAAATVVVYALWQGWELLGTLQA